VTPEDRVELIRSSVEQAFAEGPRVLLERYDELFTEDFRWRPAAQGVVEGLSEYCGRDGFARYWEDFEASFTIVSFTDGRFRAVGENTVLAQVRINLHGTESGVPIEQDVGWVFRFDGDRIADGESFMSWDDAEAAAEERARA
jgi:ketosteroid isomerase-like protein